MTRSKRRILLWLLLALLILAVAGGGLLYVASQRVPQFYTDALKADPQGQRQASDEMLQRTSELISDVRRPGRWQALFTDEQINGWLAVDLVENHPNALPATLKDPRVVITTEGITVGCRLRQSGFESVGSLTIEPYLTEPNVAALRIRSARAGAVPMPLGEVLRRISEAAARLDFPIRWQQADGDPVAVVTVPSSTREHNVSVHIDTLRLGDGEILFGGTTERREPQQ